MKEVDIAYLEFRKFKYKHYAIDPDSITKAYKYATLSIEARQCEKCKIELPIHEVMEQYIDYIECPYQGFFDKFDFNPDYINVLCENCSKIGVKEFNDYSEKLEKSKIDEFIKDCGKYNMKSKYTLYYIDGNFEIRAFAQDQNYEEPESRDWFDICLKTKKRSTAIKIFNKLKNVKMKERYPEYTPGAYGEDKFLWGYMPNKNGRLVLK
jgi:hypothetical protein